MVHTGKLWKRYVIISLSLLLAIGCAKSVSPPGGLEDKTPPEISTTFPPSGSVSFPTDSTIIIEFSEIISSSGIEKAIYITPTVSPEPKIKVSGNKLKITPREPLKEDRTYVITLGTDLKDAHNVRLKRPLVLAFSTGPTIDTGVISGSVYKEDNKPASNISIALFESLPDADTATIDSLIPDYITQTGNDGRFEFTYIPPQPYYLVAFDDANKNRRINPGKELIGLPSQAIVLDSADADISDLSIRLSQVSTTPFAIRALTLNQNNLIKLKLTKPIDEQTAQEFCPGFTLVSAIGDTLYNSAYTTTSGYPTGDFLFIPEGKFDTLEYTFSANIKTLFPTASDSLCLISYSFTPKPKPDEAAPVLSYIMPADSAHNIYPDSLIRLRFDEPVVFANASEILKIVDNDDTINVTTEQVSPFEFSGKSNTSLSYGHEYILSIDGTMISDRVGNRYTDSTIAITFFTIGADTLGTISGGIQYVTPQNVISPVHLTFNPTSGGEAKSIILDKGQIEFLIDLLPGYYTISGYKDNNTNGSYDYGSILPYQTAEPFAAPADTFRVRSRFVTEGAVVEF
ncbi:MAG: Ig-like domain-containing protein [Candidatus Zixiibacteriota bacterium]